MSLNLRIAMLLFVPLSVAVAEPHDLVLERCLVTLVEEAKVPAREAGVIVTLLVRLGQPVEKEEEIARIDDGVPHMELLKARQELEQAKAKKVAGDDAIAYAMDVLKVAEAELGMAEKANVPGRPPVHPKAVIDQLQLNVKKSEWQLKQSRLERDVAALAVTSEEVKVRAAESAIERRSIKSPITGVIHELPKHLGEWMQPGDTLAHVIRTDTLRVEGFVKATEHDPGTVRGRPVTVTVKLAGDRLASFTGTISGVREMDEGDSYRVYADVINKKDSGSGEWLMRTGQVATMTIHCGRSTPSESRSGDREGLRVGRR